MNRENFEVSYVLSHMKLARNGGGRRSGRRLLPEVDGDSGSTEFAVLCIVKTKEFVVGTFANFIEFAEFFSEKVSSIEFAEGLEFVFVCITNCLEFAFQCVAKTTRIRRSYSCEKIFLNFFKGQNSFQMTSREALAIGSDVKPPVLFRDDDEVQTRTNQKEPVQLTDAQKNRSKADRQAKSLLLQSIPNEIYINIDSYKDNAKSMWDQLQKMMMGSKVGNQMKVANCINNYEEFKVKENESLEDSYERFVLLLNELSKNKVKKKQIENNVKFLGILQPEWKKHTCKMKQMKDLSDIPLHEVYETLRQNEEEVEEKRAEKKKAEKVVDPIALVDGQKEKEKKEKKKKKKIVISSSESDSESDGSNSQRYSSTGSKNHEHRERVEGRRFEETRFVEKKPDEKKKYVNDYTSTEKKVDGLIKCYNCGKEDGKALMAEDEYWLDHSDVEEEQEETAHLCLMGKEDKHDDSEDETADEVMHLTENDFMTKMEAMMVELQDLQSKLKKEKDRVARRNQKIFELNKSIIGNKDLIDSLRKSTSNFKHEKDCFEKKISDFESKLSKSDLEYKESVLKALKLQAENKSLTKKVNGLEAKLHAIGQTDQTIFLNTPNEEVDIKEKWGLGYDNPHYLKKAIRKQPALYNFDFLVAAGKYPHLKPKFVTKLPDEVEAKETENRKNVKKMQLPFRYEKLNYSYLSETPKVLSNDYFASYSVSEMEAKPAIAKVYVPPLILESKIIELENVLSEERILVDIEQSVFSTMLKNTVFQNKSTKCSNFSKAPQTSTDNFDDLFASANNFLNSNDGCAEEIDMFDFNAPLPDHSTFVINGEALPSVHEKGESSTKVGESVSVNADYYAKGKKHKKQRSQKRNNTGKHKKNQFQKSDFPNKSKFFVSDLRKKRSEKRTEWRPKRKIDDKAKSLTDNSCNRSNSSVSDVVGSVVSTNKNLIRHMWYLDRGCSKHMTGQKDLLSNYTEKFSENVRFGNDQFSPILGYGDIIQDKLTITKVSYVEGLGHNLFSIGQFCDRGLEINFKVKSCSVHTEDGKELLIGTRKSNLYTINLSKVQTDNQVCLLTKASMQQSWLWHRRLSHLNFRYINKLVKGRLVKGIPELRYEKEHLCAACEKGKMKRAPHKPKSEPSTSSPLELLHMDLCGPMRTQSLGGKKYVLVIVNLQKSVKLLRTDNGTEFKNRIVEEYLESVGISHQYFAARMPEQNGVVERRN
ncbi:hypothetical protein L6452_15004 [Arctium lappa]|uniref:Uncharacterized protein n=1 Tax=Arctium lappa TaxID=4217 RepID=A0ACB9CMJ7_ARCLA|nr:hypothetical protein L6452_15004 [Arctium lappa]